MEEKYKACFNGSVSSLKFGNRIGRMFRSIIKSKIKLRII